MEAFTTSVEAVEAWKLPRASMMKQNKCMYVCMYVCGAAVAHDDEVPRPLAGG